MNFSEKVKLIRKSEDLKQTEFAELTGIPLSTLKKFESENRDVTISTIDKIVSHPELKKYALWFMTDSVALAEGQISPETAMTFNYGEEDVTYDDAKDYKWTLKRKTPLETARILKEKDQDIIKLRETLKPTIETEIINLPFYQVSASAGHGSLVNYDEYAKSINFSSDFLRKNLGVTPSDIFLMLSEGDSMQPTIKDNSILMVERKKGHLADGVYVFRYEENLHVKRLQILPTGIVKVISDNKQYSCWEVNTNEIAENDLDIIGRVVRVFQSI